MATLKSICYFLNTCYNVHVLHILFLKYHSQILPLILVLMGVTSSSLSHICSYQLGSLQPEIKAHKHIAGGYGLGVVLTTSIDPHPTSKLHVNEQLRAHCSK